MGGISQIIPALASAALDADRRGLVRSATWLFVGLIAIAAVGIAMVWMASSAARRTARARRARTPRVVIPDAWAEAGRRMSTPAAPTDEQEEGREDWENPA